MSKRSTLKKKTGVKYKTITPAQKLKRIEEVFGPTPKIRPSQKAENYLGRPEYRAVANLLAYVPPKKRAKRT